MKDRVLSINLFKGYIHYYIGNDYIGLLVFEKGELSDHRAIIRKNRLNINEKNLYSIIRTSFFTLLNHYLSEKLFFEGEELQKIKADIVKENDYIIKQISEKIIKNNMLRMKHD